MHTCFFIRPFSAARAGNEDPALFDAVLGTVEAAAEQAGVRLIDPAKDQAAGWVMDRVRRGIDEADVLIALITGENPNVYYELGLARREAILLVRSGETLPFDVRGFRYWAYEGVSQDRLLTQLREAIEQTLREPPTSGEDRLQAQIERFFATPLRSSHEVDAFDLLGVWRSPEAVVGAPAPPYVARCCDAQLEQTIANARITVVHGPAKAGKSRSSAHSLQVIGDRALLVPRPGMTASLAVFLKLAADVAAGDPGRAFVLWLDELDKYLKASLLEARDLERLLACQTLSIIATMTTLELTSLRAADDERGRSARLLLSRAQLVEVPGVLTDEERRRAEHDYPDLPLGPSLGESFVAVPQLRARVESVNPEDVAGVAIVRAAIDVQRLGVSRSIALEQLQALHRAYAVHLDPQTLYDAAAFEPGVRKALEPIARHSALLVRDTTSWKADRFFAPDFLVEHIEMRGDPILPAAWSWAVNGLDSGAAAYLLAAEASRRQEPEWASEALRKGGALNHSLCLYRLGLDADRAGDAASAEQVWRKAGDLGLRRARLQLGILLRKAGRTAEAIEVLEGEQRGGSLRAAFLLVSYFDQDARPLDYERVCRDAVKFGSAWHAGELGKRLAERGAIDDARALWHEGVELCIANQGRFLGDLSPFAADFATAADEALGLFEENYFRGDLHLALDLARSLENSGAVVEAERAYRYLHERGSAAGSLHLAALLWNTGRAEDARLLAHQLAGDSSVVDRILRGETVPRTTPNVAGLTVLVLPTRDARADNGMLLFAGQVFARLGEQALAVAALQAGMNRGSAECALERARLAADEGDVDQAEAGYRSIIEDPAAGDAIAAHAAARLGVLLEPLAGRTDDAVESYIEAIDRGEVTWADGPRRRLAVLYERVLPTLAEQSGDRLLNLAMKLNVREIATPSVLAGLVVGHALAGQLEQGRRVLEQLQALAPPRLDEVRRILESFADDSPAGRALRMMRAPRPFRA